LLIFLITSTAQEATRQPKSSFPLYGHIYTEEEKPTVLTAGTLQSPLPRLMIEKTSTS